MIFRTQGRVVVTEIEIDDNKKISKLKTVAGNEVHKMERNDGLSFDTLLNRCFISMMKDGLNEFKKLLKEIQFSDIQYFKQGKEMLDKEAERYKLD